MSMSLDNNPFQFYNYVNDNYGPLEQEDEENDQSSFALYDTYETVSLNKEEEENDPFPFTILIDDSVLSTEEEEENDPFQFDLYEISKNGVTEPLDADESVKSLETELEIDLLDLGIDYDVAIDHEDSCSLNPRGVQKTFYEKLPDLQILPYPEEDQRSFYSNFSSSLSSSDQAECSGVVRLSVDKMPLDSKKRKRKRLKDISQVGHKASRLVEMDLLDLRIDYGVAFDPKDSYSLNLLGAQKTFYEKLPDLQILPYPVEDQRSFYTSVSSSASTPDQVECSGVVRLSIDKMPLDSKKRKRKRRQVISQVSKKASRVIGMDSLNLQGLIIMWLSIVKDSCSLTPLGVQETFYAKHPDLQILPYPVENQRTFYSSVTSSASTPDQVECSGAV